jgi:hypothetical protein
MALDEPLAVVPSLNASRARHRSSILAKGSIQRSCSLEGANEALGAAVALGLAEEGRAAADAQEAQLGLVGPQLATVSDRAAIVIDDVLPPWRPRGVEVRGTAEAIEGPPPLIRLHPRRITSWAREPWDGCASHPRA